MRKVAAALAFCTFMGVSAGGQASGPELGALFDAYYGGNYDEAVAKAAALPDLGPLRVRFVQDTPGWIAADPANIASRRAAVAAFLVELTAARLESASADMNCKARSKRAMRAMAFGPCPKWSTNCECRCLRLQPISAATSTIRLEVPSVMRPKAQATSGRQRRLP